MMSNRLIDKLFPKEIRTERLTTAWVVSVLVFLIFDLLWCSMTTFRSMSFVATYVYAILGGIVFSAPTAFCPKRVWLQIVVWILLVALLTANMMYFRTYFTAIPASSYLLAGNLSDFKSSVTDSLAITDLLLVALITVGSYLLCRNKKYQRRGKTFMIGLTTVTLIAILITIPYGGINKHVKHLTQQCYYTNCPPVVYTVFGKVGSDMMTSAESLSESDSLLVDNWLTEHETLLSDFRSLNTDSCKRSIIMVFLESFESWPIGKSVEGKELTPFINSLVNDSTTWFAPKVLTQVGNGRSIDAQLLTLAGMMPMRNEVYAMTRSDNEFGTLPKAFKKASPLSKNYLLTGDKGTVWNQIRVARSFGIDTLLDARCWTITDKIGNPPKLSDEALFNQTVSKMRSGEIFNVGEKAFVQIIAYSSHNPFRIPDEKKSISFKENYPVKLADYMTAINYVDRSLKSLVEYVRSRPDSDEISIVIIGDHEGLAGYRKEIMTHDVASKIVDNEQFTPLIITNAPVSGHFDNVMGQVDVYSTLLDMFGLHDYEWQGMGFSALSPVHPRSAVTPDGRIVGNASNEMEQLLKDSRQVSDVMLRFNLLDKD